MASYVGLRAKARRGFSSFLVSFTQHHGGNHILCFKGGQGHLTSLDSSYLGKEKSWETMIEWKYIF